MLFNALKDFEYPIGDKLYEFAIMNYQFKKKEEWSNKVRKLRNNFSDNQLEDFKIELKKLSDLY